MNIVSCQPGLCDEVGFVHRAALEPAAPTRQLAWTAPLPTYKRGRQADIFISLKRNYPVGRELADW